MKTTSKPSKIATVVAFLAVASTGCDGGARIETEAQYAASSGRGKAVAPAADIHEEPLAVSYVAA
jgi:hypothetical protein